MEAHLPFSNELGLRVTVSVVFARSPFGAPCYGNLEGLCCDLRIWGLLETGEPLKGFVGSCRNI